MGLSNRYFAREYRPERWHICDRQESNRPIYDASGDRELIFTDHDTVLQCLDEMNSEKETND